MATEVRDKSRTLNLQQYLQGKIVKVISRKFDLSIRRTWECRFVEQIDSLVTLIGEFDRDIRHPDLGLIRQGTTSYEYFWLDRWYNSFRFHEPDGSFRNFYCNITLPPKFDNGVLDYVDLDIDVIVWPDFRMETLDWDEYELNAKNYSYPQSVRLGATKALTEVKRLITAREFPFSSADLY